MISFYFFSSIALVINLATTSSTWRLLVSASSCLSCVSLLARITLLPSMLPSQVSLHILSGTKWSISYFVHLNFTGFTFYHLLVFWLHIFLIFSLFSIPRKSLKPTARKLITLLVHLVKPNTFENLYWPTSFSYAYS